LTDFFGGVSEVELSSTVEGGSPESEIHEEQDTSAVRRFGTGRRQRRRAATAEELVLREPGIQTRETRALLLAGGVAAVNVAALWFARRRKL
jgi:hypothetical protein